MSRDFLSNFDDQPKLKENSVQENNSAYPSNELEYEDGDYVRSLCFVWPDGKQKFSYYNRLDAGEINSENDTIRLTFGPETIELTGLRLLPLFVSLKEHKRKYVYCDDARYNDLNEDEAIVNEIKIMQN